MLILQPLVLALLVGVTQYHVDSLAPILFFAIVVAIWLGLNNSARDLVRERRLYVRDRLAGLRPGAYIGAKLAVHVLVGSAQLLILLVVMRIVCFRSLEFAPTASALAQTSMVWLFMVLLAGYLGGWAWVSWSRLSPARRRRPWRSCLC